MRAESADTPSAAERSQLGREAGVLYRPLRWGERPVKSQMAGEDGFLLPVGTVTLLLADIEGSVRLWEGAGEFMTPALARLDELVTQAVERHEGVRPIEQGEGDSFVAAFARPSDALDCALELQLRAAEERWPGGIDLRLRMGIHTGEVQLRDEGNYIGPTINRAARLRDIAHGGQTLLSRAAHDLVIDRLPERVTLADLGTHRLRDLARPEQIFQLRHPELAEEFPPLRSLDVVPNNLPVQLTSFVGRRQELGDVKELLAHTRLLTLTGSGGCGKTRLALQAAAELLEEFEDGVWLADFGPLSDHRLVPKGVCSALGLPEEHSRDFVETLVEYVKTRNLLIILDNCEHLARTCTELADTLLRRCPSVTLVATSREPLGIPGETPWRVPSLSFPIEDEQAAVEDLASYESVQLFIERALKTRPNFELTPENAPAVAQICQRLDGIPLAIELAAARVRVLTPQQICDALADRFRLLTGGSRTLMPRQQTLQASVDWSYGLLPETERALLRRLSVFAGGFTLVAAEHVCSGDGIDGYQVLDLLSELVDRSLVLMEEEGVTARYRLLETIRQYGRDRLLDSGEAAAVRGRHRDFYLAFAERAEPELIGRNQDLWLAQLDAEHDNVRAALDWSRQDADPEAFLRLAGSLVVFWRYRGHFREGRGWLEAALALGDAAAPAERAKAVWGLGYLKLFGLELSGVATLVEESLGIFRTLEDRGGVARSVMLLGWETLQRGDRSAYKLLEESAELARELGDDWCLAGALEGLGFMHLRVGDAPEARRLLTEALTVGRRSGDQFRIRWVSAWLGATAVVRGDLAEARSIFDESVAGLRRAKDKLFLAAALGYLGLTLLYLGEYESARESIEESLTLGRETESFMFGISLAFLAITAQAEGNLKLARELAEEAHTTSLYRYILWGFVPYSLGSAELAAGALADARTHLDEAISASREAEDSWTLGVSLGAYARLHLAEGDHKRAESLLHEALELQKTSGAKIGIVDSLEELATVAVAVESFTEAARLFGAADSLREATGYARFPSEREAHEANVSAAREGLGPEAFEAAWNEGAAMSMDEAIAYAQRGRGERKRPSAGWDSLTPAELDVVRLVGEGLTNPQIGGRLFISKRTVQTHLYRVFAKLGVSSRAELAAEAARRESEPAK